MMAALELHTPHHGIKIERGTEKSILGDHV